MQITLTSQTVRTSLAAVALHASKDETRRHMCGVFIEYTGSQLRFTATSGHTLARYAHECSAEAAQVLVPSSVVATLIAHAKKNKEAIYAVNASSVETQDAVWTFDTSNETFPQHCDRVIPAFTGAGTQGGFFGISCEYAALAAKSFTLANTNKLATMAIHCTGAIEPMLIKSDCAPGLTVVVMPVRMDSPFAAPMKVAS